MSTIESKLFSTDDIDLLKSAFEELSDIKIKEDKGSLDFQVEVNLAKDTWIKSKLTVLFFQHDSKIYCDVILNAFPQNLFADDLLLKLKAEILTCCPISREDFTSAVLFDICNVLVSCKEKLKQNSTDKEGKQVKFLLFIDHMNDSKRYSGHLCDWSKNLEFACLMSVENKPHYFVLLAGEERNCKSFVQKIRTTKGIDVNSIKKPCKERMMKVLFEGERGENLTNNSFEVEKFATFEDMKDYFVKLNLVSLYDSYVADENLSTAFNELKLKFKSKK